MSALTLKSRAPRSAVRHGITLIELLVVMVILSIVTAATIPLLNTGVESRRIREAARLVAGYIGAAKSRAIETGRPAGVMIQRYAGQNYSVSLVGVEVPPPYCGDTTGSMAIVTSYPLNATGPGPKPNGVYGAVAAIGSGGINPSVPPIAFNYPDVGWHGLVRPGDLIRFGYQGRWYVLYGPNSPLDVQNGTTTFTTAPITATPAPQVTPGAVPGPWYLLATDGSGALPPNSGSNGVPYQILRQPTKSAVQPLQLPEGAVINLYAVPPIPAAFPNPAISAIGISGIGSSLFFQGYPPYANPILTFSPTGAVDYVYFDANPPQHLQGTLYLLVGRRDGMEDLPLSVTANNINHHSSMWVAVSPQSGLVATAENMTLSGSAATIGTLNTSTLTTARQYAQAAASLGGR